MDVGPEKIQNLTERMNRVFDPREGEQMKERKPKTEYRRLKYGGTSVLLLCLVLCLLVVINIAATVLERKNGWRVDYSFNAAMTTGEATEKILDELPYPVHIYAVFDKSEEDVQLIELLDRYAVSGKVTWEQTSPSLNPALLSRFATETEPVTSNSLIVWCETTDRWKVLDYEDFLSLSLNYDEGVYEIGGLTYESSITGAISYVTQDRVPRAIMVQGHGELDETSAESLDELLTANHYDVLRTELTATGLTLDPENDMLIFLSPIHDLSETEMETVTGFADHGGSILFTCDYSDPIAKMPNYRALLRSYGFIPKQGIVVASKDEPGTYYNNVRIDLIPEMCSTDITLDLISTDADTLLLTGSGAFEQPDDSDRNLIVSEVLRSGSKAYLKIMDGNTTSMDQKDTDETGPFSLALQARKITTEGYVSRAFVIACSTALTDSQIQSMTDSQAFTVRVTEFLLGQKQVALDIMPKLAVRPQLSPKSTQPGSMILVALPVAILVLALIILIPRKRN